MTSPPTNQKNVHELTTPCSLNTIRHRTTPSREGHSLEGLARCGPLCLAKLFLSTSPKTLSPRFNPAPAYRGRISATVSLCPVGLRTHFSVALKGTRFQTVHLNISPLCQDLNVSILRWEFCIPSPALCQVQGRGVRVCGTELNWIK